MRKSIIEQKNDVAKPSVIGALDALLERDLEIKQLKLESEKSQKLIDKLLTALETEKLQSKIFAEYIEYMPVETVVHMSEKLRKAFSTEGLQELLPDEDQR